MPFFFNNADRTIERVFDPTRCNLGSRSTAFNPYLQKLKSHAVSGRRKITPYKGVRI